MSAAGTIWPNTDDHPPIWWLAAEVLVAVMDDETAPEGIDPRLWAAAEWPDLHAYWVDRINAYKLRL